MSIKDKDQKGLALRQKPGGKAGEPGTEAEYSDKSADVPEIDSILKDADRIAQKAKQKRQKRHWVSSCCGGYWADENGNQIE